MAITAIRTAIIYLFLIVALRITGKRQLGELQPIELVVTLLISDLASVPIQENSTPLLAGLIPIAVLVSLELILSAWMVKSGTLSTLISGNPIVIIRHGKLSQSALRKLRMTVDDLMECLRRQGIFDLQTVAYAIAETGGNISVFTEENAEPPTHGAVPIVSDGQPVEWAMQLIGVDMAWIRDTLHTYRCPLSQALLLSADAKHRHTLIRKGEPPT